MNKAVVKTRVNMFSFLVGGNWIAESYGKFVFTL